MAGGDHAYLGLMAGQEWISMTHIKVLSILTYMSGKTVFESILDAKYQIFPLLSRKRAMAHKQTNGDGLCGVING